LEARFPDKETILAFLNLRSLPKDENDIISY